MSVVLLLFLLFYSKSGSVTVAPPNIDEDVPSTD